MDFQLTDEQVELQRIAHEVVERECPPALVRAVVEDDVDTDALWKTLVELEWPGLTVPLEHGGSGATAVELAVLLEELGWAADPSPFLATTTQHLPLVAEALKGPVRDERLAALARGSVGAAVLDAGPISARAHADGWVLDGTAPHVLDADRADELAIVVATAEGVGVALVPGDAVSTSREPAVDASLHLCTVTCHGLQVPGTRFASGPGVALAAERARHVALTGLAASMVGASQRAFDLVLEHIRTRHQFGQPIGGFQAVKHLAVDVHTSLERARALVQFAALTIAEDDPRRALAASMAKAAAGDAQRIAAQHGIQLFGGLGYTWENDLQLYLRRAKVGEMLLGSAHEHRRTISSLVLADLALEATA
jgi:alkylation response protein AidB-like acyl-CoA dehydrogenase